MAVLSRDNVDSISIDMTTIYCRGMRHFQRFVFPLKILIICIHLYKPTKASFPVLMYYYYYNAFI